MYTLYACKTFFCKILLYVFTEVIYVEEKLYSRQK